MTNREKVIKGLGCCADLQRETINRNCEDCPYNDDRMGTCKTMFPLLSDALELLKEQEDSVPLKPLAEWLAGYAAPPRDAMRKTLTPGGHITHQTLTEAWENTLRETNWEKL